MSTMQQDMIRRALEAYQTIYPCGSKARLEDCFTVVNGKCVFWFNTEDDDTHVVVTELAGER